MFACSSRNIDDGDRKKRNMKIFAFPTQNLALSGSNAYTRANILNSVQVLISIVTDIYSSHLCAELVLIH